MYKKAFFGPHTNLEDPNNFIDPTILEGDNVQMWKNFMKYQKTYEEVRRRIEDPYTLETNLVSELEVEREWRYCCSYLGCFNLEDTRKFLNCSECVKVFKRKYCSVECQEKDWPKHQKYCDNDGKSLVQKIQKLSICHSEYSVNMAHYWK